MVVKPIITASEISVEYREFTREKFFLLEKPTLFVRFQIFLSLSLKEKKLLLLGKMVLVKPRC